MAEYTRNYNLELAKSNEKYDVKIVNKNNQVIDSELHKLELKNRSQDELLATKESLNSETARATTREDDIYEKLSSHDTSLVSHNDIRILIQNISEKLEELSDNFDEGGFTNEILDTIQKMQDNNEAGKLVDALIIKEVFQSVSDGKKNIALAITDKGVDTSATDSFSQMAVNISAISNGNDADVFPLIKNICNISMVAGEGSMQISQSKGLNTYASPAVNTYEIITILPEEG